MQPPSDDDDDETDYNVDDMLEMHQLHPEMHQLHPEPAEHSASSPELAEPRSPAPPMRPPPGWGPHTPQGSPLHARGRGASPHDGGRASSGLAPTHAVRAPPRAVAPAGGQPPASVCGSTYTTKSRRTVSSHNTSLSAAPTVDAVGGGRPAAAYASARAPATLHKAGGGTRRTILSPEEYAWEADTW